MSPEEISMAQLLFAKWQLWVTTLAIFLGPLTGVIFTFWVQSRKERRDAKLQLFLTLIAERKDPSISKSVSQALNKIEVVFHSNKKVKDLWRSYYALLAQPPGQERGHTWLELLTAMAVDLGYSELKQTDLDKFYIPQGHVDDMEFQQKVSQQWSRVLENTENLLLNPKTTKVTPKIKPTSTPI